MSRAALEREVAKARLDSFLPIHRDPRDIAVREGDLAYMPRAIPNPRYRQWLTALVILGTLGTIGALMIYTSFTLAILDEASVSTRKKLLGVGFLNAWLFYAAFGFVHINKPSKTIQNGR